MLASKIALALATAPATLEQKEQANWTKVTSPTGVRVYISNPNKSGECREVHLSGFAFGGPPAVLKLPDSSWEPIEGNGAATVRVLLDKAPADFLTTLLHALPSIQPEASPKGNRGGRSKPPAPKLADLVAQERARLLAQAVAYSNEDSSVDSPAASADDSSDASDIGELIEMD